MARRDLSREIWDLAQRGRSQTSESPVQREQKHAVNLRHPGYSDDNNVLLTAEAADDSNGGVDYDQLRLAGCMVAGNRWDGFLSLSRDEPFAVGPDGDGMLLGSDYYLHFSKPDQSPERGAIDRRSTPRSPARWPIVARHMDWRRPPDGLPGVWGVLAKGSAGQADGLEQPRPANEAWTGKSNEDVQKAVISFWWELIPKTTSNGRLGFLTRIPHSIDEGLPEAARLLWDAQVDLHFGMLLQKIFEQVAAFLKRDVERDVQVIDADGRKILLTTGPELRAEISSNRAWRWHEDSKDRKGVKGPEEGIHPAQAQAEGPPHKAGVSDRTKLKTAEVEVPGDQKGLTGEEKGTPLAQVKAGGPSNKAGVSDRAKLDTAQVRNAFLEGFYGAMARRLQNQRGQFEGSNTASTAFSEDNHIAPLHQYPERLISTPEAPTCIRIFHLWPGVRKAMVLGHLESVPLSDAPSFSALSYCWGSMDSSRNIRIDGGRKEVGPNLYQALLRLRRLGTIRRLWIDAICINQSDMPEKTGQVTLMRDIYERAEQTIVWLGEDESTIGLAFDTCLRMAADHSDALFSRAPGSKGRDDETTDMPAPVAIPSDVADLLMEQGESSEAKDSAGPPTYEESQALATLLTHPWFTRMWIVQELGVSSNAVLQCGVRTLDWDVFFVGIVLVDKLMGVVRGGPPSEGNVYFLANTRGFIQDARNTESATQTESSAKLDVISLLSRYRGFDATDPRDKVFALLGISTSHGSLHPDYSTDQQATYKNVAVELLSNRADLGLLACCLGSDITADRGLPSWVPDWNDARPMPYRLHELLEDWGEDPANPSRVFRASGDTSARAAVYGDALLTTGLVLDKISSAASTLPSIIRMDALLPKKDLAKSSHPWMLRTLENLRRYMAVLEEWQDFAGIPCRNHRAIPIAEAEDNYTDFARTLWTDLFDTDTCVKHCTELLTKLQDIASLYRRKPSTPTGFPRLAEFEAAIRKSQPGFDASKVSFPKEPKCLHVLERRLAKTEAGRLCLVAAGAAVGDQVVLLHGGKTPYILRRVDGGHVLLGEAFVHGVMYGEAWDEARSSEICIV